MRKVKTAGLAIAFALCAFSVQVSRAAFELDLTGPRSASMGGGGVALTADNWAASRNPALAPDSRSGAGLSWSQQFGLPELTREELSAVTHFRGHALGLSAASFGSKLYRETEVGVLWAREIRPKLCIGMDVRVRSLDIETYTASQTITLSAGVTAKPVNGVTVGAVWRNLNEPRIPDYHDRIRESLTAGLAAQITDHALIALDVVQEKFFPAEIRVGAEARVLPQLVLRVGGRAEPVRPSAGLQIDVGRWSFLYAGDLHPDLGASHHVGLGVRISP